MNVNIPKTECVFSNAKPIDMLNSLEAINLMVEEQKKAAIEVKKAINQLILQLTEFMNI